ncbi:MAG: hypothetical protein KIT84_33870 [Labilithrix sp.]|nr:hypothetical protein [Labilithrix sp.]
MKTLRVVCYAVNGAGTGHLCRLVGIARWLRRYAAWAGARAEIYFLTTSEADALLFSERFASFKLPSKTAAADAKIDKSTYVALAKQWVWHSLGLLRPDLFVVDTFARGSFGELLGALDLCRARALVLRPMIESFARRPDVASMLPLYDAIVVPEAEADAKDVVPDALRARTRWLGPMCMRERPEVLSRDEARAGLGLAADDFVVYATAGGGGDAAAEGHLARVVDAALAAGARAVVGSGPLYRGAVVRRPGVVWLGSELAVPRMPAFDVAVSAAGYNSFVELMWSGVPTVFLPQEKIADDQAARAARAERGGAGVVLPQGATAEEIRRAIEALRADHARAAAAARALVPKNHAREAAAELLRLALPPAVVDRAEAAVDDALLTNAQRLGIEPEAAIELMHALDGAAGEATPARELGALAQHAERVLEAARRQARRPGSPRVAVAVVRRAPACRAGERAAAAAAVISACAPFEDWESAIALVGARPATTAERIDAEVAALAAAARERGQSLLEAIAEARRAAR